jgi:hypothetical protein
MRIIGGCRRQKRIDPYLGIAGIAAVFAMAALLESNPLLGLRSLWSAIVRHGRHTGAKTGSIDGISSAKPHLGNSAYGWLIKKTGKGGAENAFHQPEVGGKYSTPSGGVIDTPMLARERTSPLHCFLL